MCYRLLTLHFCLKTLTCGMLYCALNNVKILLWFQNELFLILQLVNHCNITLSEETLLLLNPLGDFEHDGLQNTSKYFKHKCLLP